MHKLTYRITAKSPLLFMEMGGDPNMVSTHQFIPGSAILGYFAGKYIAANNLNSKAHENTTFGKWFLDGELCFGNAHICTKIDSDNLIRNYPIPVSIQEKKDYPKKIVDLLYIGDDHNEKTKSVAGFGQIKREQDNKIEKQAVGVSLNFHHVRDSETGTTKNGGIFNYESIDAGQIFEGDIMGDEATLNEFLAFCEKNANIRIGRSKNTQYGNAMFEVINTGPVKYNSPVMGIDAVEYTDVALTFLSDAIILDKYGNSSVKESDLLDYLKKKLGDAIEINKSFAKTGNMESFVSVWKLKRPSETVYKAGSCFFLTGVDQDKAKKLMQTGIGERRGEGFGQVVFGWQLDQDYTEKINSKIEINKPTGDIPPKLKNELILLIKDKLNKQVEKKAMNDVIHKWDKKNLPSKSLIGKLEDMLKDKTKQAFQFVIKEPSNHEDRNTKLKDIARKQLQKSCNNNGESMYELIIENNHVTSTDLSWVDREIKILANEIGYQLEILEHENDLYKAYWLTFFRTARKLLSQNQGG